MDVYGIERVEFGVYFVYCFSGLICVKCFYGIFYYGNEICRFVFIKILYYVCCEFC